MRVKLACALLTLSIKLRHLKMEWIAGVVMEISEKIYASYMEMATTDYYYRKFLNELKEETK